MSQTQRTIVIAAAVAYLIVHLATLAISPLPWFDEVVFADITRNYIDHGTMEMTIVPEYYQGQVYQYGPVYFLFQSSIVKLFGLNPVSFRLLNFLCGLGVVAILCNIFRRNYSNNQPIITWILAALVLLDTIFNQNLHSGRMDLVSVFFVMCSLLFAGYFKAERKYHQLALVGVFAALAFLTTPRSVFLLTAPAAFFILRTNRQPGEPIFEQQAIINSLIALAAFIIPVLATIELSVGLVAYYNGMTAVASEGSKGESMSTFVGGSLLRESYENHVILMMIVVVAIFYKKVLQSSLLTSLVIGFAAFSLFVKEAGPYSAMMMPFIYFLIIALIADATPKLRNAIIMVLLGINIGMFFLKNVTVLTSAKQRNVNSAYYARLGEIPSGSRILSDYRLFYWALDHDHTFESYGHYKGSNDAYVQHVVDEFAPDFVIVKPGDETRGTFVHPEFKKNYEVVSNMRIEEQPGLNASRYIRRFAAFDASFEGIIYKRVAQPR